MQIQHRIQRFAYPHSKIIILVIAALAAGCALDSAEPAPDIGDIGADRQSVSATNALSYNRLVYNRLVYNRLAENRLVYNELSENRLVYNSLDNLESSAEGRELLAYIALCALDSGEFLVTEHSGATYEFAGNLGLAPGWVHGPLSASEAQLVSACLIAHINAFGVSVLISLRSECKLPADTPEMEQFPLYEATFFGDVFGSDLRVYACLGGNSEIAAALSSSRSLRVCADPSPDCQVRALGYCRDICEQRARHYGWTDCWADGERYSETMSSYLPADLGTPCTQRCQGNGNCTYDCEEQASILDCSSHDSCTIRCEEQSFCTTDAVLTSDVKARVRGGSMMEIDCHGVDECRVDCKGTDSRCEIDCQDAQECRAHVSCKSGAQCSLRCAGADDCGFKHCHGPLHTCPDGTIVCNQDCPSGP